MVATDLDPRFTFDSFVVGPANRLASAVARRVADAPGTSYNPLFIYSSSGLGKSHILNGIAHYAARVHPGYGVVYVAVESFLEELTEAFYERAIKSENPPPQSFMVVGDQALRRGDKVRAKQQFELAIKADPRLGEDVFIKLGAIALENSESAEAGAMWRRALEINPANASLQEKLDQLGAAAGA